MLLVALEGWLETGLSPSRADYMDYMGTPSEEATEQTVVNSVETACERVQE
jgi:hypothetical protein